MSYGIGALVMGTYWCWMLHLAGRPESREQYEARVRRVERDGYGRAGWVPHLFMQRYRHPRLIWSPAIALFAIAGLLLGLAAIGV